MTNFCKPQDKLCKITGTCLEFLEALITDSHGFIPEVLQGGSVI